MLELITTIPPQTYALFLAASIALYLTPGADMMFIIASGATGGGRSGAAAALGVTLGCLFHVALAVLGVAALLQSSPVAFAVLRYAGAAYLLWLAITAWRAPPAGSETAQGAARPSRAFRRGATTNILNPKVSLFVLAFLPQFVDPALGAPALQILIFGLLFALASAPFNCAYGLLAGHFARHLRRAGRTLNRLTALLFGGLAARLAFT